MLTRRAAVIALASLAACSPEPAKERPDGAVREFVERITTFDGNESDAQALFSMLSERARKNLKDRADRYGAASGKAIEPAAMLVPGRMVPRFEQPLSYRAQVVGKYGLVEVSGAAPGQVARIPCVREDGVWRVDLVFPELLPMRRRPATGR